MTPPYDAMSSEEFSRRLHAWLDDPQAPTAGDVTLPPARGYKALEEVKQAVSQHTDCAPYPHVVWIRVTDTDRNFCIVRLTPDDGQSCIVAGLRSHPAIIDVTAIALESSDPSAPERKQGES